MLLNLFNEMRAAKVPVSVRELLDLINALKQRVTFADMDEFYYLARAILVKDERHFDKFDRAFGVIDFDLSKVQAQTVSRQRITGVAACLVTADDDVFHANFNN